MKKILLSFIGIVAVISPFFAQDIKWPRELTNEGSVITLYQPQVESWKDYKTLDYRMAFELKPFEGKSVVGVLYSLAETDVDMDNHMVLIKNIKATEVHFPSLDADNAKKMTEIVRSFITPERTQSISVEQIVACTPKTDSVSTITVNNDPPVIFMSKKPTILLQLEGNPVKAATNKENLQFVVNANFPLFYDESAKAFYLYDGLEWQKSTEISGPWKFTSSLPKGLVELASDENWQNLKEIIPAVTKANKKMPQVFYSTQLAELILFEGEPSYKSVKGTALKFATNTDSDIFFCNSNKLYYYLTAGRWFSSSDLNGPWSFATPYLPADFMNIPDDSPASSILAFVPGTEQAKDAVMIAQIPTTIEVDAAEAAKKVNITYSGEPKFEPIEETQLSYAVNTTEKVIKVSTTEYYACYQGLWFFAGVPLGPWVIAATVPKVIYSMPPSSPVYNVTYVTQTVTTTNVVVATYTAGYTGVYFVATPVGVVIVAGTGFYHPPYYYYPPHGYPIFYPHPVTYGCYAYHPYPYGGVAYHASYNPHTGVYGRSATAYGPYGSASVGQAYNSHTGTYARGASVSTPYGSRSAGQAYNPYTGASGATRQGSNANAQWGATTVNNGRGQSASAAHITTDHGSAAAVKTKNGDMYATKNGEVYKNTGNGWEDASKSNSPSVNPNNQTKTSNNKTSTTNNNRSSTTNNSVSNNSAKTANPSATQQGSKPTSTTNQKASRGTNNQELNREAQNRQRGNTQTKQYSGRSSSGASRSGGGGRSGGRR